MRILMIAMVLSMILPAAGFAGDPWGCGSELSASCPSLRISVCPRGDFESIAKGCGGAAAITSRSLSGMPQASGLQEYHGPTTG